ncbi:DUF11 domain-containing protein [Metaclostridioides mangenotii]|uniref:DUF11 domain-containing protein n=1 Tax=Metaclostridioides mangenotii TaxID=1540 RepID=UPI0004659919|nr:DUF11 domain-containing protein [Clostridioides mangenotii]
MATVSGRVVFDIDRSATINAGDSGLANVPVILQNTATNVRLVVLTDSNGNYSFINVPNGDYRIVESYGTVGGIPTPGDFTTAVVGPFAVGANPPISFATNPPIGSTNLDSLTPDTLFVTVSGSDIANENFLNGPVIYTPLNSELDSCVSVSDVNLIDAASNGTFGFFSQGTPANTGAPVEPYPGVTPDFIYVLPDPSDFTPDDGEYTVQNIMTNAFSNNLGAWWRIADHTTGNETGRMMIVNGFNPGSVFFRDVVMVQPNTNYLFSSWILNLFKVIGFANPALGVRIFDPDDNILYSATLGTEIPVNTNAPEWKEIGTVINSQNNTNLTVEFLSEGPAAIGNDYAIDDISLMEIQIPEFIPVKSVDTPIANVGETVTYTVTLTNTCSSSLTSVFFQDIVPNELVFIPQTVTINTIQDLDANPNTGFALPDVPGGSSVTVTFDALVVNVPIPNPTFNSATINYLYTPVPGGIDGEYTVTSNVVPLEVTPLADVSVIKTANPNPVLPGELLVYTIEVSNLGPSNAENVELIDAIPPSILGPEFSIDGGVTFNPWTGIYNIGTLTSGETRFIQIRGTVSPNALGIIINTATVTSSTPDPNPDNNSSTVEVGVNSLADVSVVKAANPNPVLPGQLLVYTIEVSNAGPSDAENVELIDVIPSIILGPEFSIDGGVTWNPWTGIYNIGTLTAGVTRFVEIRGTVSPDATGIISNTATVTSTTPDPNPDNNSSTVEVGVNSLADVSVVKTANPNPVLPGQLLVYTIEVSNVGPSDAEDVVLTDNIPPEILGPEFSIDGGVTWNPWTGIYNIGALISGTTRFIQIRGTVSLNATGIISNTATVTSTTPDPDPDNNSSTVEVGVNSLADVSVVKIANPNPVLPGRLLTYIIQVSNAGPSNADNVVLTDNIPPEILGAEFSIDGGVTWNPWTGIYNIGTLNSETTRVIQIRGTVSPNATGLISNTATVTSTTPDPDPDNNSSTVEVGINSLADVSVVKIANPNPVLPGGLLTFIIQVANAGPSNADNVVLTDDIPLVILEPEFSIDGGVTWNPWIGSYNIGTLISGATRVILIRGTVSPSATGIISNTATVTSITPDPDPDNNSSTVDVDVETNGVADISVEKTLNLNPVLPCEFLVYNIKVSNAGPSDAENVVIIDDIPRCIICPEFSIDGELTWNPWSGSYSIGTLATGETITIQIRGQVSSCAKGKICNITEVTSTTPDPDPSNNISTAITNVVNCCEPCRKSDSCNTKKCKCHKYKY